MLMRAPIQIHTTNRLSAVESVGDTNSPANRITETKYVVYLFKSSTLCRRSASHTLTHTFGNEILMHHVYTSTTTM